MSDRYGPFCLTEEQEKQRLLNLTTVEEFMNAVSEGTGRYEKRKPLYDTDGRFELTFSGGPPDNPNLSYCPYSEQDRDVVEQERHDFPDWSYFDVRFYPTNDPHTVFLECSGRGMRFAQRWEQPHYYENHYLFCFTLKDGKIKRVREVFNPYNCMRPANDAEMPEGF